MDPEKIFKSKVRKEIFKVYFTNPDKEYYLRELERMLRIPVSMIRRELQTLEKNGIFLHRKQGNLVYYFLNKNYPLFDEFKSIVSKTIGVQGLLRAFLQKFKTIRVAFIYGSFAKNEEKADSDIDLCIIGDIDERRLVNEINRLEKILKREINYTLYKPEEFNKKRQKREGFITDIMDNPKIFLIGDDNDLR